MKPIRVAVLGLGEAGSLFAADLVRAGDEVRGFDPAPIQAIAGVKFFKSSGAAIAGCGLVLAVTPAAIASDLFEGVVDALDEGLIYADLSTGSPGLKEAIAKRAAERGVAFADVALMAPVSGRGLTTPALASGSGAEQFAALINSRGGRVEDVGAQAGAAAARKLLRSVVMKGLAALLLESTEAAARYGQGEWFWNHIVDQLTNLDGAVLTRLRDGTPIHAARRLDEMEAARDLLAEFGVPPTMTAATVAVLRRLTEGESTE